MDYTLQLSREKFAKQEPLRMAEQSDCYFSPATESFTVPFLGRTYTVSYPDGSATDTKQQEADATTTVLLLHYLSNASGAPLSGEWITFRELPSGAVYTSAFQKRAIIPFVKAFGTQPTALTAVAGRLNGKLSSHGDLSCIIPVLPRIPLLFILWYGDNELPPGGNILFDRHAHTYMHTEDFAVLAGQTVSAMRKLV
jgi:hypothetical protein